MEEDETRGEEGGGERVKGTRNLCKESVRDRSYRNIDGKKDKPQRKGVVSVR